MPKILTEVRHIGADLVIEKQIRKEAARKSLEKTQRVDGPEEFGKLLAEPEINNPNDPAKYDKATCPHFVEVAKGNGFCSSRNVENIQIECLFDTGCTTTTRSERCFGSIPIDEWQEFDEQEKELFSADEIKFSY